MAKAPKLCLEMFLPSSIGEKKAENQFRCSINFIIFSSQFFAFVVNLIKETKAVYISPHMYA